MISPAEALRSIGGGAWSLAPRLPRSVWVLEMGGLINALGGGFVLPFSVIYLHDVRHFPLGVATGVLAVINALGIVSGPLAGTVSDRLSPRAILAGSLALLALGFVGFPFVRAPWQAFGLAVVAGVGNGSFYPSQSALLGGLTTPGQRHVGFSLQRLAANLGYGIGGLLGGLIATTAHPGSFDVLFFVDAATFVGYILVLAFVPDPPTHRGRPVLRGRYREVLADHTFVGLLIVNGLLICAGYGLFETLVPVYAKNDAGVSDPLIGALFLVNTGMIVIAQLPIARLVEGRRRMPVLFVQGILWAVGVLIVWAGGSLASGTGAGVILMVAFVAFSLGECVQAAVVSPTAADLAPAHLLARYMALVSFTWQGGLAVAPALGGPVLGAAPAAVWLAGAAVCLGGGAVALKLEPRLPAELRRTPRTRDAALAGSQAEARLAHEP